MEPRRTILTSFKGCRSFRSTAAIVQIDTHAARQTTVPTDHRVVGNNCTDHWVARIASTNVFKRGTWWSITFHTQPLPAMYRARVLPVLTPSASVGTLAAADLRHVHTSNLSRQQVERNWTWQHCYRVQFLNGLLAVHRFFWIYPLFWFRAVD